MDNNVEVKGRSTLQKVTLVLLILTTIGWGFFFIPLAWNIPLTVSYAKKTKNGEPISTGRKVCTLLLQWNLVAFILMLLDKNK